MVYTVTLNPALDYVMQLDLLTYEDINRAKETAIFGGGKGINVSFILSQLGIANRALGFVGGFSGEELERLAKKDGIDCDFTRVKNGNTRINVKIKAEREYDINADGPLPKEDEVQDILSKINALQSGDYLVMSGSVPKGTPDDIYEQMMRCALLKKAEFIIDTTGKSLLRSLPYHPFLIKPNHHEIGELFGVCVKNKDEIVHYARKLQEMGARNVLVSMAQDGAILLDETGQVHSIGTAKGTLVNSCGCGDSMVAGFLAGYLQTKEYAYALRLGAACGSATAFSIGLAKREEIEKVLQQL